MSKIGIMGGTFNPIHIAHLIMAECAYEQLKLDKVLIMPTKKPPHKPNSDIVNDDHRSNMIHLAIKDNPHFEFSSVELEREGTTYTVDTLEDLTTKFPENEYYFILGADSLFQIEQWYQTDRIMKLAHIVAFGRYHLPEQQLIDQIDHLTSKFRATIHYLSVPNMDVSSNMIRDYIKENKSIRYYVPEPVIEYINDNKLYL
ncbi:MAG: nicotinate (nicotinamide) nucleotide adenylyltransferase [Anaerocolumna sp.]|jgi:nicotinate-nucleotide adenylyltransferase|nr:nicotinate (nicotinamide) nucleotide adenylyltransferase [Anaerocolumna sp.]